MIEEFNQEINKNLEKNDEGKNNHYEGRKWVKVNGKLKELKKEELLEFYKKRPEVGKINHRQIPMIDLPQILP